MKKLGNFESVDDTSDADENNENDIENEDNMEDEDDMEDEGDMKDGDTEKKQESDDGGRGTGKMSPFEKLGKAIKNVLGKKEGAENNGKTDAGKEKTPEDAKNEMDKRKEDFLNSLKVDSNGNYVYRKNESGGNAEDSIKAHGDNGARAIYTENRQNSEEKNTEKTKDDDEGR